MKTVFGWIWYLIVQAINLVFIVLGLFVLIPLCVFRGWTQPLQSLWMPGKIVEEWRGPIIDFIYGNGEDGVLGNAGWKERFKNWPRWGAYVWSAIRNPTNNLRFVFRWYKGPFQRWKFKWFYIQIGWYSNGFPIFSIGRIGPELPDEPNHGAR